MIFHPTSHIFPSHHTSTLASHQIFFFSNHIIDFSLTAYHIISFTSHHMLSLAPQNIFPLISHHYQHHIFFINIPLHIFIYITPHIYTISFQFFSCTTTHNFIYIMYFPYMYIAFFLALHHIYSFTYPDFYDH